MKTLQQNKYLSDKSSCYNKHCHMLHKALLIIPRKIMCQNWTSRMSSNMKEYTSYEYNNLFPPCMPLFGFRCITSNCDNTMTLSSCNNKTFVEKYYISRAIANIKKCNKFFIWSFQLKYDKHVNGRYYQLIEPILHYFLSFKFSYT